MAAAAERASAPQLPLYEVAREAYTARYCEPLGRGVLPHEAMLVGATVGMAAAAVTTPLDVVKSRMMVGAAGSAGVGAVVRQVVAEGGPAALFTGVNQRVAYLGLSNAIFFIMYDLSLSSLSSRPFSCFYFCEPCCSLTLSPCQVRVCARDHDRGPDDPNRRLGQRRTGRERWCGGAEWECIMYST